MWEEGLICWGIHATLLCSPFVSYPAARVVLLSCSKAHSVPMCVPKCLLCLGLGRTRIM